MSNQELQGKTKEIEDLKIKIEMFDCHMATTHNRYKEQVDNLIAELTRKEKEVSLLWTKLDMANRTLRNLHTELSGARAENYNLRSNILEKHVETAKMRIMLTQKDNNTERTTQQIDGVNNLNTDIQKLKEMNTSQKTQVEMKINDLSGHTAPVRRLVPLVKSNPECLAREIRHQKSETIASVAEKAKQREEEEEKRFERAKLHKKEEEKKYEESKQRAAQKQKLLEQKLGWENKPKELVEKPPVTTPLPDWEKNRGNKNGDKENRERERSRPRESHDDKPVQELPDFRQITQVERPSVMPSERDRGIPHNERESHTSRDRERDRDRDIRGERDSQDPVLSSHFQSNMSPGFQKQQAEQHKLQHMQQDVECDDSEVRPIPICLNCGGLVLNREIRGVTPQEASVGKVTKAAEKAQEKK